ncbi:MAG: helix-turn-helix transcriptional regulator, partial [Acidobacteria bacterium]|nr:helix-turn-helix transcriptional regulator [Acidobacteriota bacterium]
MFRPDQLGPALRALRSRQQLKQLQVAARAGITSSMLSGYENGRKMPTLATLEKVLGAMECGLPDLLEALQARSGADGMDPMASLEPLRWPSRSRALGGTSPSWGFDLEEILGPSPPLSREEAAAFGEMLSGYCRWLRYLRHQAAVAPPGGESPQEGVELSRP